MNDTRMMVGLVSIIVPVFNIESYLGRCVESLLAQSYENVEIILVDDESSDGSSEICDRFARIDSRVRAIHQQNAGPGPAGARNSGIERACGEFITFVDGDDWVHPDYVAALLQSLLAYGADIAVCSHLRISGDEPVHDLVAVGDVRVFTTSQALSLFVGPLSTDITVAWGKLYRATLLDGITYPQGRTHEDEFTTHRLLARASKVVLIAAKLYYYRQRPGSVMAEADLQTEIDEADGLLSRAQFFESLGMEREYLGTYRAVFNRLRRSRKRMVRRADQALSREFEARLALTVSVLSKRGRPFPVRAFAAAYLAAPCAMDFVHDIYGSIRDRRRPVDRSA